MKSLLLIILLLSLTACASMNKIETRVSDPEGNTLLLVESKSDAKVEYEREGERIVVDNQGQPSVLRNMIEFMFLRSTRNTSID